MPRYITDSTHCKGVPESDKEEGLLMLTTVLLPFSGNSYTTSLRSECFVYNYVD